MIALTMLSIEKSTVLEIPNINENVIEKFISDRNRRMDLNGLKEIILVRTKMTTLT